MQIFEYGQKVFVKNQRADLAYIVLHGELSFFDNKEKQQEKESERLITESLVNDPKSP